jgi:hypothetical protein
MWQRSGNGDWQSPLSWTPERINPASSDILVFKVGGTTTATNVPDQTIGQLIVSGNTTVNLQSATAIVLTIAGGDGDDLTVEQNSALNFNGANAIAATLVTGATANVTGAMTFSSSSAAAHRFTAVDPGAISFNRPAVFTAGIGFTGNPFGAQNLNSVVFGGGSTYVCIAGADPFGTPEPDSVVVFKHDSLFSLQGNVQPSFSGRSYSNFEVNCPSGNFRVTGSSAMVMDDLTLIAGNLDIGLTGSPGHSIKGNISTLPNTVLDFQPAFPGGTINLNGAAQQTVNCFGQIGVNDGNTFVIDNPSGIVALRFLAWNLELANGVLTITDPNLTASIGGTVVRTNGYINGDLIRHLSTPGSFVFDVGTANGYSPVTLNVTAGSFPNSFEVRAIQTAQPNIVDPTKALSRYWTLFEFENITADLTFQYLDPADIPPTANEANFVIQRHDGSFSQPSGVIDTSANTFHVSGVTNFARDWTLAEPGALLTTPTPTPTNTPTATATTTSTPTNTPTVTPTGTPAGHADFDYDADGRSDISVFRPSSDAWYLQQSTAGLFGMEFGYATDKIAPADFDGDGKTDIAVYRPETGIWYVANSSNGAVSYFNFGIAEDLPTPADYDGDGRADYSVFRPSTATWYRQNSHDGSFYAIQFGLTEDKPTIGDFDGDGRSDIAIFRPSDGAWYELYSSDNSLHGRQFGFGTDIITPADYDGDGRTDVAVFRPSTGLWYIANSSDGSVSYAVFGLANDIPAPGDFDGDGKTDISVFRPSDGTWYRTNSSDGSFYAYPFGTNGDKPTQTAFRY